MHTTDLTAQSVADIKSQLNAIWQQSLPMMRDRLERLDAFVANAGRGENSEHRDADALDIAHKLAGSLEIFGFAAAGRIAHDLEVLLRSSASPDPRQLSKLSSALRSSLRL